MQAMYSRLEHDDCNMNAWSATVSLELIMTPRTHIRLGTRSSNTSKIPQRFIVIVIVYMVARKSKPILHEFNKN